MNRCRRRLSVAIGLCASLLISTTGDAQQTTPSSDLLLSEVANIDRIADEVRALVVPRREATLSSLVAARIDEIAVNDGDRFKRGDVLLSFQCAVQSAALQSALAKLKQYELTHAANIELRQDEAVSKLDLALSEVKIEEGKADVALSRAHLKKCKVRAPYDGSVANVLANEYETVEIGEPLLEILDDSRLEVMLHIPSTRRISMSEGTRFKVSIDETKKVYDAVVSRMSSRIDAASRTFEVTAQIVGSYSELLAGMSGTALFDSE